MNLIQPAIPLPGTGADIARTQAKNSARIDEVARQFEGQFAQMLIKSMREASFGDSLFPGENQTFRDMYDQQLAKSMTQGKGLGLAPVIARQLGGGDATQAAPVAATTTASAASAQYRKLMPTLENAQMLDAIAGRSSSASSAEVATAGNGEANRSPLDRLLDALLSSSRPSESAATADTGSVARIPRDASGQHSPESFISEIWAHAKNAARELGVDPRALAAQAALETGWGKKVMQRDGNGGSAHNLFGIKATGWNGDSVRRTTQEYRNGQAGTEKADFRAYKSTADSFSDYVRLLKTNPRYQQVLAAGGDVRRFASALQKAGYATDPGYAAKIAAIANSPTLNRAIATVTNTFASR